MASAHLSLLNSRCDSSDVVIHQNHVRCLLGNIRARHTHRYPDVGCLFTANVTRGRQSDRQPMCVGSVSRGWGGGFTCGQFSPLSRCVRLHLLPFNIVIYGRQRCGPAPISCPQEHVICRHVKSWLFANSNPPLFYPAPPDSTTLLLLPKSCFSSATPNIPRNAHLPTYLATGNYENCYKDNS